MRTVEQIKLNQELRGVVGFLIDNDRIQQAGGVMEALRELDYLRDEVQRLKQRQETKRYEQA